jgi:hypothetical protein
MIVADVSAERSIALEFVYVQGTPASVWEIEHDMNCHPGVTVIDSGNNQVEGSVTYDSLNKVTISFTSGFSGKAVLR